MNYISEIRAFYDIAESLDLSSSCICLWHALMYQANKLGWMDEFSLPISTLELRTKLGKSSIYAARNTLKQHGLINVKERDGRQSALYTVYSLCLFNGGKPEHKADANPNTKQSQNGRKPELLNKQDETRQDDGIIATVGTVVPCPYSDVVSLYNSICFSFPKVNRLSDARKKAIKARFKQYSLDDFRRLFKIAESSAFLKGQNKKNWSATFDWLIRDSNMAKILDGNYNDKLSGKPSSAYKNYDEEF